MNEPTDHVAARSVGALAAVRRWSIRLLVLGSVLVVATLSALFLQASMYANWEEFVAGPLIVRPLDIVLLVIVIVGVWGLFGRLTWALGLVASLSLLLAGVNRIKVEMRNEPVYPSDISLLEESASLAAMVEAETIVRTVLPVVGALALFAVVGRLVRRRFPREHTPTQRRLPRLAVRAVAFVAALGLLVYAGNFNQPGNLVREAYNANAAWKSWSQLHNYQYNGFLAGTLYNMPMEAMERPAGYGREAMQELSARYIQRAEELNVERRGSLDDVNVVLILGESFADPTGLQGLQLAENPVPNTQRIMSETVAGEMYPHSYGGGTATMEFESLTGQLVGLFRPQVSSPYQMFVSGFQDYPSLVGALGADGHHTVAIHSYHLDMYKRRDVYRVLGFDEVIDDAAMQSKERIESGRFISDAAAFDEVLYHIEQQEGPVLTHLVTMQNHTPYEGAYSNPIETGLSAEDNGEAVGQYARGVAHSDEAFGEFISDLKSSGERTIVVFYGDHHPGVYSEGFKEQNLEAVGRTPFLVWDSAGNEPRHVPGITPGLLLPLLYDVADAPVPPYIALLDDMLNSLPVILRSRMLDVDAEPVSTADLDPETAALLEDMRMVQYDLSMGERYAMDEMWPGAATGPTEN